jgi:hypothetical protein
MSNKLAVNVEESNRTLNYEVEVRSTNKSNVSYGDYKVSNYQDVQSKEDNKVPVAGGCNAVPNFQVQEVEVDNWV